MNASASQDEKGATVHEAMRCPFKRQSKMYEGMQIFFQD